jgi:hypothetical protein
VLVERFDHLTLIEAPLDDTRTLAVIAKARGVREGTPAEAYAVDCGLRPSRFHFNEEVYRALEERTLHAICGLDSGVHFRDHT